jgi:hypothetical protein
MLQGLIYLFISNTIDGYSGFYMVPNAWWSTSNVLTWPKPGQYTLPVVRHLGYIEPRFRDWDVNFNWCHMHVNEAL